MSVQWMKHALIASVLTVLMTLPATAQQRRRVAAPLSGGPAKPAAGTPDSQRLSQILAKIEQRLTILENQAISQQRVASTRNQTGSSLDLATIEGRVTALENQVISQPPATPTTNQMSSTPDLATMEARVTALENQAVSQPPATNQAGSTSGELTCTKLTVVNSVGQPKVILSAKDNGGQAIFRGPDGLTRIILYMANSGGGQLTLFKGGSTDMSGQGGLVIVQVTNNGGRIDVIDNTGQGSSSDSWTALVP